MQSVLRSVWTLDTLNGPHLVGAHGRAHIGARAAVLLAYLAMEGPHSRARIAALLWPDSTDGAGRANLRQLLVRLTRATNEPLVEGSDMLTASQHLLLDVISARERMAAGDHAAVARLNGAFLADIDVDDLHEDIASWIATVRTQTDQLGVGRAGGGIGCQGLLSAAAAREKQPRNQQRECETFHARLCKTDAVTAA